MPTPALPRALAAGRRRARWVYGAVVTVLAVGLALVVAVVVGTGEAAHATLRTSPSAAPAVPGGTIAPAPTTVWRTTDLAATGNPLWVGTVVTRSTHQLAGRDATTGEVRWSYTRTDMTVCDAAQQNGRAYVLFRHGEDCDELSTFDAQTGARGWFRTLPDRGEGRISFGAVGLVLAYPGSFHAIATESGIDRYPSVEVTGSGCEFTAVEPGDEGVLVSESCADGGHLALWSNNATGDPSVATQLWRVSAGVGTVALAVASDIAYAYQPTTGTLGSWAVADGADRGAIPLDPAALGDPGHAVVTGNGVGLPLGDRLFQLAPSGTPAWSVASGGSPTVAGPQADQLLVPTASGAARVSLATGAVAAEYTFDAGAAGSAGRGNGRQVFEAGAGLLVAGDGLAYLR